MIPLQLCMASDYASQHRFNRYTIRPILHRSLLCLRGSRHSIYMFHIGFNGCHFKKEPYSEHPHKIFCSIKFCGIRRIKNKHIRSCILEMMCMQRFTYSKRFLFVNTFWTKIFKCFENCLHLCDSSSDSGQLYFNCSKSDFKCVAIVFYLLIYFLFTKMLSQI